MNGIRYQREPQPSVVVTFALKAFWTIVLFLTVSAFLGFVVMQFLDTLSKAYTG